MRRQLLPAVLMMVVFTVVLGLLYPLAVTGIAQLGFGDKANGSELKVNGKVVGSKLLGQTFTKPKYFQGRPSAAGAAAAGTDAADPNDENKTVPNDPKDLSQDISSGLEPRAHQPRLPLDGGGPRRGLPQGQRSRERTRRCR